MKLIVVSSLARTMELPCVCGCAEPTVYLISVLRVEGMNFSLHLSGLNQLRTFLDAPQYILSLLRARHVYLKI